jgi:mercuric ion binding protein
MDRSFLLLRKKLMKMRIFLFFLAFMVTSGVTLAASRTVTLDVKKMTCAVCLITVKKALAHVAGVQQVAVSYSDKTATVQFDDAATTADQLTVATKNAGYPSSIVAEPK